jgi:hypothetical protein
VLIKAVKMGIKEYVNLAAIIDQAIKIEIVNGNLKLNII